MRIGLVSVDFLPNIGGVAAHVAELGKSLARLGHETHIITIPIGAARQPISRWEGMTIHRPFIINRKPLFSWMMNRWLRTFLRKTPLDVLHVHGLRPLEATRGLPLPVIFTNHTSGFLKRIQKGPAEYRKLMRRMGHIVQVFAPSQELVEATRQIGYSGPVQFISNGVDTQRFCPGPGHQRAAWGVQNDQVAVLLARRLVEKNGVTVFAEAVTKLAHRHVRIIFAGDGAERSRVEQILKRGQMLDSSVMLGSVPNDHMPDVYRSADISVLPSFMEATSITGLESMACGLPLVGTRVGGIPTLVDEGKTGLLVEPGAPDKLASALDQLIGDPRRRGQMGQQARERAVQHFSWDSIAAETAAAYASCLKNSRMAG